MTEWLKTITFGSFFRAIITIGLLLATLWALDKVYGVIDEAPTVNEKGEVTLDKYQRTKDILLVVLPLLTTALGYWFGAKESEQAQKDKVAAVNGAVAEKQQATEEKEKTHKQMQAILDSSKVPLLDMAKSQYPQAFE